MSSKSAARCKPAACALDGEGLDLFSTHRPSRRRGTGFSLVEIMVAMVIGMFGIIVMMQVFALSEERKRTTTGGGDAMTEGVMALYGLQSQIRQSGYGISDRTLLGCNVLLRAGVTLNALAPVTVNHASIPAGDANTDTLLVIYGNTNGSPQGDTVNTVAGDVYGMATPTSFASGDKVFGRVYVSPVPATCNVTVNLTSVASAPVGSNVTVTAGTGVAGMVNGTLFNLGQTPTLAAYAIRGGNLTMCDYTANDCSAAGSTGNSAIWVPIANNIVSLRAEYGHDTSNPMDGIVDAYDRTTPTTACGWVKTSAIRLALVARSAQFEKTAVTAAAPTWEGTADIAFDLSGYANWQKYRYKVFQTVVPIRNVSWLGVVSGC